MIITPRLLRPLCLCSAALLLALAPARAASTYYDNLSETVGDHAGLDLDYAVAQSFLTDGSAPMFALNFIVLSMGAGDAGDGAFTVSVFSDSGSKPGSLIEALSGNTTPTVSGNYTYSASSATLLPNTLYWVVAAGSNSTGEFAWNYTESSSIFGVWTTLGWSETFDGGATWEPIDNSLPQMMAINAVAVPEPAEWAAIAGMLTLGLVIYRRRTAERG